MDNDNDALLIDWVERAALENLRSHLLSADYLINQANTTLAILLTGAGAALAYAVKGLDVHAVTVISLVAAALSVYLFVLCGVMVKKCIWVSVLPVATNQPSNLYQPEFQLIALRKAELRNIEERINIVVERNLETAKSLNNVRAWAIIGTPALTFVLLAGARLFG